jgi:hypothetical protein
LPYHGPYTADPPKLPSTAAAFNLFPRRQKTKAKAHQIFLDSIRNSRDERDLKRLHSDAFSHLRKDLTRNQEALVHKIRSNEASYLNSTLKPFSHGFYDRAFDDLEQEDVDIILPSNDPHLASFAYSSPHPRHHGRLDDTDGDDQAMLDIESSSISFTDSDSTGTFSSPCISPRASSPTLHETSDVIVEQDENGSPRDNASTAIHEGCLLTPQITQDPPIRYDLCLHDHEHNTSASTLLHHHPHNTSFMKSEEELASLSLALANGACELNDYGHARLYAPDMSPGTSLDHEGFIGVLWH